MTGLIEYFAKQKLFGNLLTLFVLVIGIMSALQIRREVFPNVTFDIITISTIFPAASPEEVEKLLTNPIEQDLKEVDGIKKLRSVSAEGRSYITAQLDPDQTTEEKAKSDIQDVVDRFELPAGAEQPVVTSLESKQSPIIEVSIAGSMPEIDLRNMAKEIERELETIAGVARVVPRGVRDREIWVQTDPKKLSRYRLAIDDVVSALKQQNLSIPAGTLEASGLKERETEKIVRTIGEFKSPDDIGATVIRANELGASIRVRDVAEIFYQLEEPELLNRTNGKPALSLTVLKKERADAIQVVDEVKSKMGEIQGRIGPQLEVNFLNDLSTFIRRRVSILTGNLLIGLILVLLVLAAILPGRVALIVSLGIPFSFLGAMILFRAMDYSVNLISLIGLIIVSGMLVDDAIVVTDNAARFSQEGMDPEEAAIHGTKQIWPALTASVMTTVFAFLPMMFMSGIFGKFVKQIPIGVIFALLFSLFEAFFILPQHYAHFVRANTFARENPGSGSGKRGLLGRILAATARFWDDAIVPRYMRLLGGILRRRYWVALGTVALFIGSMVLAQKGMRFILFPPDGIEIFMIRGRAPVGTSLNATGDRMKPLEDLVKSLPKEELDNFVTTIGIQQEEPNDPNTKRGSEYGQIMVFLTPEESRERTAQEIIEDLRKKAAKPPGLDVLTFDRVSGGPPVGKPVSVGVRGLTYEQILPAVKELEKYVASIEGATDVTNSYAAGKQELQIKVRPSEAAAANLSVASIGNTVRGAYDGIVSTSIQELEDEVDVRVLFPPSARASEATLEQILIPNPGGALVPLSSVATIRKGKGVAAYDHENNQREVRVTAEVDTKVADATRINNLIREKTPELMKKHPGISFHFGGEDEDTQESMASLFRAFIVAFFAVFLMLVLTFKKILQPLLVLITIPLGIISVIWTFFLHGMPLSFMGMLGIIALAGVIVNNAIVFVDFVNQGRDRGLDERRSILEAARMRIRPIFLTTITTVFGLLPTAYGIGGLDQFVVPIAMALGWGLFFGSIMTALVFPAAVAILDDFVRLTKRIFRKFSRPAESMG